MGKGFNEKSLHATFWQACMLVSKLLRRGKRMNWPERFTPTPSVMLYRSLLLSAATLVAASSVHAIDASWSAAAGNWTLGTNWTGGTEASGADFTATFANDITADRIVNLDVARTIGNITFGDANTATAGNWTISGAQILTLDRTAGVPTITVNALGTGKTATISSVIAGSDGLKKDGAGTLALSGANTFTGGTTVSDGILVLTGNNGNTGRIRGALTIESGAEVQLAGTGWGLGWGAGLSVTSITLNGGTLNKVDSAGGGIGASTINMTGGLIKQTGTVAIDLHTLAGGVAFNTYDSATTATVTANLNLRAFTSVTTFTVADGAAATDLSIAGIITGNSATQRISKAGAGTMKLSGANTFAGGTTISAGTLEAGSLSALGTGAVGVSGGALVTSVASVTGIGNLTLDNASSVLTLNGTAAGTITLSLNASLSMSAGTWQIDLASGMDAIARAASGTGTFSISGGTIDLGGGGIVYTNTYNLLSGFSSGTVSGLTIDGYDKTNWAASLGTNGTLSFQAVPEPSEYGLIGAGALAAVAFVRRRRKLAGKVA
jgi:fibronectin-binding autotransporter adhesin